MPASLRICGFGAAATVSRLAPMHSLAERRSSLLMTCAAAIAMALSAPAAQAQETGAPARVIYPSTRDSIVAQAMERPAAEVAAPLGRDGRTLSVPPIVTPGQTISAAEIAPAISAPAIPARATPINAAAVQVAPAPAAADAPLARRMPAVGAKASLDSDSGQALSGALRHLPSSTQGYRLAGETAAAEWPIFFTDEQVSGSVKLQIGFLSAVSVMPEASMLTVQVNDIVIGQTPVQSPHSVKVVTFDIPSEVLRPGFNALRLSAQQRHRVDCSLAATFELWTQIDPAQTGFLLPAKSGVKSVIDLPALPTNPQGSLPIRAVMPGRTDVGMISRMMKAVQMIVVHGRFEHPLVDVDAAVARDSYGINLAVGTFAQLEGLPGLENLTRRPGPVLEVRPAGAGGRTTLIVSGDQAEDVDAALAELEMRDAHPPGTDAGLRAALAFPGKRLSGSDNVRFSDLGAPTEEFSGRLYRMGFQIMMPADFYPADYGKAELSLTGAYAAGLTSDAQLVVSANDRKVIGMRLPDPKGAEFKNLALPMPLSALRPGLNRIELEAYLPAAADKACDPLAVLDQSRRFLLSDESRLILPSIARIARLPDLSVTATGAFPYGFSRGASWLYLPEADRNTVSAAASLVGRLASVNGSGLDFAVTLTPPEASSQPILAVAPFLATPESILRDTRVEESALANAWAGWRDEPFDATREGGQSRTERTARYNLMLQRNFPPECRVSALSLISPNAPASGSDAAKMPSRSQRERASRWQEDQDRETEATRWTRAVTEWVSARSSEVVDFADRLAQRAKDFGSDREMRMKPDTAIVIAQTAGADQALGAITLVTAPTGIALREGVECASDPRVWGQMAGRMSMLDVSEAHFSSIAASSVRFVSTQPPSIQNARLILAGWFSVNALSYVLVVVAIGMILGTATYVLVTNIGRRNRS